MYNGRLALIPTHKQSSKYGAGKNTVKPITLIMTKTFVVLSVVLTISCTTTQPVDPELHRLIAQKLMLDFRYYCETPKQSETCTEPMTTLPPALSEAIGNTGIGGVVLFADNLQDTRQILQLNRDLQRAAIQGGNAPLFIAIDQEGGRVVRIPRTLATSFDGNMAIGASYEQHGIRFASKTGEILAKELMSLGFNLNFAPTVDVNVNPHNPVINVRAFSENPQLVAALGTAQMAAMQNEGMMATLKHFPGHGDTNVDSHTGLPRVEHNLNEIEATDLFPFQYAIDNDAPAMIMTAHIQYPQLDDTQFTAKDGEKVILPATMSRKILTTLLREKMGFNQVIVTDALNMAGISHYFDETEAVLQTFAAGADIALMPLAIRSPADIAKLKTLINDIAQAVYDGRLDRDEIAQSAQRIYALKAQYKMAQGDGVSLDDAVSQAENVLGIASHREVEQALADSAIVEIKNAGVLPVTGKVNMVYMSMPDTSKCMALTFALKRRLPNTVIHCRGLTGESISENRVLIEKADMVIVADISPDQGLVEMGGMDDITTWLQRPSKEKQLDLQMDVLKLAKELNKGTVFISLRTPYNVPQFAPYSDAVLASFSYNANKASYFDDYGRLITQYEGPIFNALADVLTGNKPATGRLPVSIDF